MCKKPTSNPVSTLPEAPLSEIDLLKKSLAEQHELLLGIIGILPFPLIVIDKQFNICLYNAKFEEIIPFHAKSLLSHESVMELQSILEPESFKKMKESLYIGNTELLDVVTLRDTPYVISLYPILESKYKVLIFRNLNDTPILKEEISSLMEATIESNLKMVQQIGEILGEESSKRIHTLKSIVSLLK